MEMEMEGGCGTQQHTEVLPRGPETIQSTSDQSPPKKNRGNQAVPPENLVSLLKELKKEDRKLRQEKKLEEDLSKPAAESSSSTTSCYATRSRDFIRQSRENRIRFLKEEITILHAQLHDVGRTGGTIPDSDLGKQQQQPELPSDQELQEKPAVDDPVPPAAAADDDDDEEFNRGKSAAQVAEEAEQMADEEERLDAYRSRWESSRGSKGHVQFPNMTQVSPMHFANLTPGCCRNSGAIRGTTLQIFSIQLKEVRSGFEMPLSVYGVVAARDVVDRNRNLLFSCHGSMPQKLSQDDPLLRLIGPSRAIVYREPVDFEVQLRVTGRNMSRDRPLISRVCSYTGWQNGVSTLCLENCFCKIEMCMEIVARTVQATILSVRVKDKAWPFDYGGRVACSSPPRTAVNGRDVIYGTDPSSREFVLLDSCGEAMPDCSDGYLCLSRKVVSVQLGGTLKFFIQAYSSSGDVTAEGEVSFMAKSFSVSQSTCFLGDTKVEVEITVAWSLLVSDKDSVASHGWEFEASDQLDHLLSWKLQ